MAQIVTYARPSRLYRYRPLPNEKMERELKAIEEGYIYCSGYASLNDPMEGGHRVSTIFSKSRSSDKAKNEVEKFVGSMGVASFSEIKNHEAMWAYYAGNFQGICVSYKTTSLLSGFSNKIDLVKMNYSEEPPVLLKNSETPERRAKLSLSYKTLRWSPEREWRIFSDCEGKQMYKKVNSVSAVYIGARVTSTERNTIIERMERAGINCYIMQVESYNLRFKQPQQSMRGA